MHMSMTLLTIVLVIAAALVYGAIVLYGARIDGRRQAVREKGLHPVTGSTGEVHAREEENEDVGKRS